MRALSESCEGFLSASSNSVSRRSSIATFRCVYPFASQVQYNVQQLLDDLRVEGRDDQIVFTFFRTGEVTLERLLHLDNLVPFPEDRKRAGRRGFGRFDASPYNFQSRTGHHFRCFESLGYSLFYYVWVASGILRWGVQNRFLTLYPLQECAGG